MELCLNEARQNYAHIEVWENDVLWIILLYSHLWQEAHDVFVGEALEEGSASEFLSSMLRQAHVPATMLEEGAKDWTLNGFPCVLKVLQVIVDSLKLICENSSISLHGEHEEAEDGQNKI